MTTRWRVLSIPVLAATLGGLAVAASPPMLVYDVRAFGAKGDGRTVDTAAINAAIEAAAAAGGGTVVLPAGTYPSYSIHLKSHVALELGAGATLLAAEPTPQRGRYDAPEPNEHDLYQDFGHSHCDPEAAALRAMDGQGNKAIALKLCRNVRLRGFSILNGGHWLDIDACRNVRVSNTSVNSPNDDAIVLKSSHALGVARPTENVTITNCQVSGYDLGTFLAGTFGRTGGWRKRS